MSKICFPILPLQVSVNRQILRQKGFSLIELMISLTIGILLMASVLMIVVASSQSSRVSDAETAMNEDGMIALGLLQQQIRLAGYSKNVTKAGVELQNFVGTSIRGCDFPFLDASKEFHELACGTSGDGGAAIAVRYEADTLNTMPVGAVPSPSNCSISAITSDTTSAITGGVAYALADNRYFVQISGTGSERPELSCRGATADATYEAVQPLIENVEKLKLTYGIVATSDPADRQIVTYRSASELDTAYSGESTEARWKRVVSVKICLLMRSSDPARDGTDTGQSYKDCDGATQTATDGYLRRAFITTAALRNKTSMPIERVN